jgi:hypothetical protein
MPPLPAATLRSNVGTWAVPVCEQPAVAAALVAALPPEEYDPLFLGQELRTTYFDTRNFDLRKARHKGERYLTLRLRCYSQASGELYAVSVKTEAEKWRQEVSAAIAHQLLDGQEPLGTLNGILPGRFLARLQEIAADEPLGAVVAIACRRYAVENKQDRLTLDVGVRTDTDKSLPFAVLEFKSADADAAPPGRLPTLGLRPVKLSKFLWATGV